VSKVASAHWCVIYPALIGFLHGAAVCHSAGVSLDVFARQVILPALKSSTLAGMFRQLAQAAASRRHDDNVQAALDTWKDGLDIVINNVESASVDAGLLDAVRSELDRASAQGYGQKDLAAVFETLLPRK
jgi:3-hydroxyisobutyrate dehydrogenase-like beta-hydroxyacid dehydrogenase